MHFTLQQTITTTLATAAPVALFTWGLSEISNRKRAKEAKEAAAAVAKTAQDNAVTAALAAKEARIDERAEALYLQCEERLSGLEREVKELKAEVHAEREERKIAEVTAQAAHFRAENAETELAAIRIQLIHSAAERDQLAKECSARDERINLLNVRVAELEAEVTRLEAQISDHPR